MRILSAQTPSRAGTVQDAAVAGTVGVDPSLYSFSFSAGVGNAAAPEPGLLLPVGASLLALGLSRRRTI